MMRKLIIVLASLWVIWGSLPLSSHALTTYPIDDIAWTEMKCIAFGYHKQIGNYGAWEYEGQVIWLGFIKVNEEDALTTILKVHYYFLTNKQIKLVQLKKETN